MNCNCANRKKRTEKAKKMCTENKLPFSKKLYNIHVKMYLFFSCITRLNDSYFKTHKLKLLTDFLTGSPMITPVKVSHS